MKEHGNPTDAWSVGQYAKRSATIHLCSNDVSHTAGGFRYKTTLISLMDDPGAPTHFTVWDPDQKLRTAMAKYPAKVRIDHLDGTRDEFDTDVPLKTVGGDDPGVAAGSPDETMLDQAVSSKAMLGGPSMIPDVDPAAASAANLLARDKVLRGTRAEADNLQPFASLVDRQASSPCYVLNKNTSFFPQYAGPNHFLLVIPLANFPLASDAFEAGRQDLQQRLAVDLNPNDPFYDDPTKGWLSLARRNYRIEMYHTANSRDIIDAENDHTGATFELEHVTMFDVLGVQHGITWNVHGAARIKAEHVVVVKLPDDEYFQNFFEGAPAGGGDYDLNRDTGAVGNTTADTVFTLTNLLVPVAVGGASAVIHNFRWNVRKMPHVLVQTTHSFPPNENHCDYRVTLPNTIGYPEHKRCLVQVQSVCLYGKNQFLDSNLYSASERANPVYVGVVLDGVGGQNVYSTFVSNEETSSKTSTTSLIGMFCLNTRGLPEVRAHEPRLLSYGFDNSRNILDDGVLINSPFGKQLHVRLINLTSKQTLDTGYSESEYFSGPVNHELSDDITENPTHLTLRLLFLDDDEIPDR